MNAWKKLLIVPCSTYQFLVSRRRWDRRNQPSSVNLFPCVNLAPLSNGHLKRLHSSSSNDIDRDGPANTVTGQQQLQIL